MIIIGLVGEKGSGKDTFAKFFEEFTPGKKVVHVRFSDLLKQTLKLWDLEVTRANLQKLALFFEQGFGDGTLAHAIQTQIKNLKADFIILDGMRWFPDIDLLRSFPKNKLIYITADKRTRFERLKSRGEKAGESTMSYEQFLDEEKAPNELLISQIGSKADFQIKNEGSLEDFKESVKNFCEAKLH